MANSHSDNFIINQDLDVLRAAVAELQEKANEFVENSSFTQGNAASGSLCRADGSEGKSIGKAVKGMCNLDLLAQYSLGWWKETVDNLSFFLSDNNDRMEEADAAGAGGAE